jgi:hypothetical protein
MRIKKLKGSDFRLKIVGDLKIDRAGLSTRAMSIDLRRLGTLFCSVING